MAITWAQVVAFAPELDGVNPAVQALILARVQVAVPASQFCAADLDLAQIYLAAHMGSIHACGAAARGAGASGPIKSESVGGLSVSYADSFSLGGELSRGGYERTKYGMAYLEIARASMCGSAGLGMFVT